MRHVNFTNVFWRLKMAFTPAQISDIKQNLPLGSFVKLPGDTQWYDHFANQVTLPGAAVFPGGCIFEFRKTGSIPPAGKPPIVTGNLGTWYLMESTCAANHQCAHPTAMDPLMPSGTQVRCPCE